MTEAGKRLIKSSKQAAKMARLLDKIDGLEADLDSAVEVAWNLGAKGWVKLNYPNHRVFKTPDRS